MVRSRWQSESKEGRETERSSSSKAAAIAGREGRTGQRDVIDFSGRSQQVRPADCPAFFFPLQLILLPFWSGTDYLKLV